MDDFVTTSLPHLRRDLPHPYLLDLNFIRLIHFAHSLSGCYFMRLALEKSLCSWQYSLLTSTFCVVAGGVTANLVVGLAPRVLNNDFVLPCTVFCWYLMNYCPYDLVFRLYHSFIPFKVISEALHRLHQLRSVTMAIVLGGEHSIVGALVTGLVAATASSVAREYLAGKPSALQKPGYTFTVLCWVVVLFISDILGKYTYSIVAIYLVLVEIYFGIIGTIIPEPFPLNLLSKVITVPLGLRKPQSRVQIDKEKRK